MKIVRPTHPLIRTVRRWLIFFIAALLLSGLTAFPIESELAWICGWWPEQESAFYNWLWNNYTAIKMTNEQFPALAYGYDWLAFAHIMIGVAFIGVYKHPVRNQWVVQWAIICCICVIPTAFICGWIRQIPFFHILIDCSFGVFGLALLLLIKHKITVFKHHIHR